MGRAIFGAENWQKAQPKIYKYKQEKDKDFPSGPGLKNPPTSAGDKGLIPGPGRSHIPWNN